MEDELFSVLEHLDSSRDFNSEWDIRHKTGIDQTSVSILVGKLVEDKLVDLKHTKRGYMPGCDGPQQYRINYNGIAFLDRTLYVHELDMALKMVAKFEGWYPAEELYANMPMHPRRAAAIFKRLLDDKFAEKGIGMVEGYDLCYRATKAGRTLYQANGYANLEDLRSDLAQVPAALHVGDTINITTATEKEHPMTPEFRRALNGAVKLLRDPLIQFAKMEGEAHADCIDEKELVVTLQDQLDLSTQHAKDALEQLIEDDWVNRTYAHGHVRRSRKLRHSGIEIPYPDAPKGAVSQVSTVVFGNQHIQNTTVGGDLHGGIHSSSRLRLESTPATNPSTTPAMTKRKPLTGLVNWFKANPGIAWALATLIAAGIALIGVWADHNWDVWFSE